MGPIKVLWSAVVPLGCRVGVRELQREQLPNSLPKRV